MIYIACKNKKWALWLNDKKISPDFENKYIALKGINHDWSKIAYVAGTSLYINDSCITSPKQGLMINSNIYLSPDFNEYSYLALENFKSIFHNTQIFKSKLAIFKNGQPLTPSYWGISYWNFDPDTEKITYIATDGFHPNGRVDPIPCRPVEGGGYKSIKLKCLYSESGGDYWFTDDHTKVAYVNYPSTPSSSNYQYVYPIIRVNALSASTSYAKLFLAVDHFRKTGEVIFAGISLESPEVVHGKSNVMVE